MRLRRKTDTSGAAQPRRAGQGPAKGKGVSKQTGTTSVQAGSGASAKGTPPVKVTAPRRASSVYSYYATDKSLRTDEGETYRDTVQERSSKKRRATAKSYFKAGPFAIAAIAVIAAIAFNCTLVPEVTLRVKDPGGKPLYRSAESYAGGAAEILRESASNDTKFSINTKTFMNKFKARYPELNTAVMVLPILGRKPVLYISSEQPELIVSSRSKVFVIDGSGRMMLPTSEVSPDKLRDVPIIQDESGLQVTAGDQVLTTDMVTYIRTLTGQLRSKDIKPTSMVLPALANELRVRVEDVPYFIKFDTSGDARVQAGTYLAVRESLGKQGITPAEYIDVRVEEKAFYK